VFYVWFDALLNYYTALGYARDGEDLTGRYWPATYHIIGKDILKFHTVYWPAMLMAADIAVPRHVFVHGFLLGADGRKMSKSLGNVLDPFEVIDRYGTDALRFYLMRDVVFGGDGAVGLDAVRTRYDAELANEYGNLASRTLNMLERYCDGAVPAVATDPDLHEEFARRLGRADQLIAQAELSAALEEIWQLVRRLNRYVEERAPWSLARDEARAAELELVLASLAEGLRAVTVALEPYMPAKTAELLDALGAAARPERAFGQQGSGARTSAIAPLFPKTT
jgi:methionyl-tRNA synthetase